MNQEMHQKVKTTHLKRNAYLYIRQSTPRQVLENVESTKRQYALRQRAVALGRQTRPDRAGGWRYSVFRRNWRSAARNAGETGAPAAGARVQGCGVAHD